MARISRFCLVVIGLLYVVANRAQAQTTTTQIWDEYMLNYPFAGSWNVELAAAYTTALEEPRWRALAFQLTPEYALSARVDLMGSVLYESTMQYEMLTTREVREMIGTRIHLTPFSRVLVRLLVRLEQRNLYYIEMDDIQRSTRSRLRLESIIPLNKPTIFSGDKLWYMLADAEVFGAIDQQVDERFANKFRFRLGAGYRLNYAWRFEFVYTLQGSRNTIAGDFDSMDNIFRFRIKTFLHGSKPSAALQGNGN